MSDDLWDGSWAEHDLGRRQAALDLADAHLETVMPFLLAARSPQEYAHRSALAQGSIAAIAHACDLDPEDLMATARRRYELCRDQRGRKVGFCETIRKHSPLSGAKRNSHAICRRNSGRHFADGTRTGC